VPDVILTEAICVLAANPEKVTVIVSPYPPVVGVSAILDEIVNEVDALLPDVSEALIVWGPLALEGALIVTFIVPVAEAVVLTAGVKAALSNKIETGAPGA
jgi:sugar/nucleoside kinase (ribokinase family)